MRSSSVPGGRHPPPGARSKRRRQAGRGPCASLSLSARRSAVPATMRAACRRRGGASGVERGVDRLRGGAEAREALQKVVARRREAGDKGGNRRVEILGELRRRPLRVVDRVVDERLQYVRVCCASPTRVPKSHASSAQSATPARPASPRRFRASQCAERRSRVDGDDAREVFVGSDRDIERLHAAKGLAHQDDVAPLALARDVRANFGDEARVVAAGVCVRAIRLPLEHVVVAAQRWKLHERSEWMSVEAR